MHFTCEKDQLINTINTVQKAVSLKSPLPVLEGIHMETNGDHVVLKGTDTSLYIKRTMPAFVEQEGCVVLPARLLFEIVSKYPIGDIVFKTTENNAVSIECGKTITSLQYMNPDDFPDFPEMDCIHAVKIAGSVLKDMINKTIFATALSEDKPILTGVLFELEENELNVVALDGYRLSLRREEIDTVPETFRVVIPAKSLKETSKILDDRESVTDICFSENMASIRMENTEIYTRLLEGDFVKYKNILPEDYKTRIKVETKGISDAIERASILAREGSEKNLIKLSIRDDMIVVTSNSEIGNAYEEVPVYIEGSELDIAFNAKYVTDVLHSLDDEEVVIEFNTNVSPCIIRPESGNAYLYLILPVQIRG